MNIFKSIACISFFLISCIAYAQSNTGKDNNLEDFPRLEGEKYDSARIQRAIDASAFRVLKIPAGDYLLDKPLQIANCASLDMHKSANFTPVSEMDFMLTFDGARGFLGKPPFPFGEDHNLFIKGGNFNCKGMSGGVLIMNYHHFTYKDSTIRNAKTAGLRVDSSLKPGGQGYELVASNIYLRCTMKGRQPLYRLYCNRLHDRNICAQWRRIEIDALPCMGRADSSRKKGRTPRNAKRFRLLQTNCRRHSANGLLCRYGHDRLFSRRLPSAPNRLLVLQQLQSI